MYRGFLKCAGCGCAITTETHKGHNYLHCTHQRRGCEERSIREERIHEQVSAWVERFAADPEFPSQLEAFANTRLEKERAQHAARINAVEETIAHAKRQLQLVLDLLLKGVLSENEYFSKKNELVTEQVQLNETLSILRKTDNPLEPVLDFIRWLNEAISLKTTGTPEEKRDFLKKACSNLTFSAGTVRAEPESRWKLWLEWKLRLEAVPSENPIGYQTNLLCR